eukprot:1873881-Pleurochrysis_carterae.AAC.1
MDVSAFPPSDSCKTRVSFELRYGTKTFFPFRDASARAIITLPSAERDWLMLIPSFKRAPSAPVLEARSEPAKSTRLILDHSSRFSPFSLPSISSCCTCARAKRRGVERRALMCESGTP